MYKHQRFLEWVKDLVKPNLEKLVLLFFVCDLLRTLEAVPPIF
jgi:hypothetical protein